MDIRNELVESFQTIPILTIAKLSKNKKYIEHKIKYRTKINKSKHGQYGYRLKALDELIPNMYILMGFGLYLPWFGLIWTF